MKSINQYKKLITGTLSIITFLYLLFGLYNEKLENNTYLTYQLTISPENLVILEECRTIAMNRGVLTDNNQPYVDAKLKVNQSEYEVKIKLKGSLKSHWSHPSRWSYRVIIKEGHCLENNLKVFSLQSGTQRGNLVELYYHHLLKVSGLIQMEYTPIQLKVNGEIQENYVIEEFFDAPLLHRNHKIPGPILKFDFDEYWKRVDWVDENLNMLIIMDVFDNTYPNAPIKSFKFKSKRVKIDKHLKKEAIKKLEGFRNGRLKTSEVFDVNDMGKYFAVNTVFGSQHPALATNIRLYFNPATQLLEPIGYDMELIRDLSIANEQNREPNYWPHKVKLPLLTSQLFTDSLLTNSYLSALNTIIEENEVRNFSRIFEKEIKYFKEIEGDQFNDHLKLLEANISTINSELKKINK